jgi:hypothetical protein
MNFVLYVTVTRTNRISRLKFRRIAHVAEDVFVRWEWIFKSLTNIYCYLCNIDVFEIVENKNSFSVEVSPNNSFTYYIYNYMESKQITCKRHYRKWKYKVDCRFPIALKLYLPFLQAISTSLSYSVQSPVMLQEPIESVA